MWQLHRDPRRRAQYHCVFAFIGFSCFCKKTKQKGKFLKKDVSARAKISRMQSHSPKRLLPSTRVYIMRTFYSSYKLEYRVSTRTIRGSLISQWWHGEAHSLVLRDLSPRGRGMATANTGVSCQDPPPPPPLLDMRAHEKHTTLSSARMLRVSYGVMMGSCKARCKVCVF